MLRSLRRLIPFLSSLLFYIVTGLVRNGRSIEIAWSSIIVKNYFQFMMSPFTLDIYVVAVAFAALPVIFYIIFVHIFDIRSVIAYVFLARGGVDGRSHCHGGEVAGIFHSGLWALWRSVGVDVPRDDDADCPGCR